MWFLFGWVNYFLKWQNFLKIGNLLGVFWSDLIIWSFWSIQLLSHRWYYKLQSVTKIMEKNCYLNNFVFLTPSPSCVKLCYGFPILYRGRGGILNTLSKIPIIICHWFSKIYKKKRKIRFYACWFRKPKCALMSWLCYGTFCHEHNDSKRCQNGAQNAATIFLSYYYLALDGKRLLQALNDKCCSLVKLLCIYFCYFIEFNHV